MIGTALAANSIVQFSKLDEKTKGDTVIILGAATTNGKVSPVYQERIHHGIWLYENGYADCLIMTDGVGNGNETSDGYVAKQYAISKGIPEDEIPRPTMEQQLIAPEGDVFKIPGNVSAFEVMKEHCGKVIAQRKELSKAELAAALKKCLALPDEIPVPDNYRRLPRHIFRDDEHSINRYLIENDERILGVINILTGGGAFQLPNCNEAVFYLPDFDGKELETLPEELYQGKILAGFDSFGVGNLIPASCGVSSRNMQAHYGAYWHFAGLSHMLGKTFPGLQMEGILAALKLLKSHGARKVTLIGKGYGAMLAAYTALLAEDMVEKTILLDSPEPFEKLIGTYNERSFTGMVPDLLKYADWTDIARCVNAEMR